MRKRLAYAAAITTLALSTAAQAFNNPPFGPIINPPDLGRQVGLCSTYDWGSPRDEGVPYWRPCWWI